MEKLLFSVLICLLLVFTSCTQPGSDPADETDNTLILLLDSIPDIELDLVVTGTGTARYIYVDTPTDPFSKEEWYESDINIFYEGLMTALKDEAADYISTNTPDEDTAFSIAQSITFTTDDGDFPIYVNAGKYDLTDNGIKIYLTLANTSSDPLLRMYIHHYLEAGNSEYTTDYFLSQATDDSDLNFFRYDAENHKSYICEMWVDGDNGDVDTNYYEFEVVNTNYSNFSLFHQKVNSSDTELDKNVRLVYTRAEGYHVWQKEIIDNTEETLFYNMSDGSLDAAYSSWPAEFTQAKSDWPSYSETEAESYDIASMIPASDGAEFTDLY